MIDKKLFLEKVKKTTIVFWTKTHINQVCKIKKKLKFDNDDAPYPPAL